MPSADFRGAQCPEASLGEGQHRPRGVHPNTPAIPITRQQHSIANDLIGLSPGLNAAQGNGVVPAQRGRRLFVG
jgi:hypothetical protein